MTIVERVGWVLLHFVWQGRSSRWRWRSCSR